MKKSTFMLGVMSFALLGFVSCNKNNEKAMAFEATTTQFEVVESEDRAYMDANCNVYFEQGDVVRMFNISATPSESECADYAAKSTGTHVYFEVSSTREIPLQSTSAETAQSLRQIHLK